MAVLPKTLGTMAVQHLLLSLHSGQVQAAGQTRKGQSLGHLLYPLHILLRIRHVSTLNYNKRRLGSPAGIQWDLGNAVVEGYFLGIGAGQRRSVAHPLRHRLRGGLFKVDVVQETDKH